MTATPHITTADIVAAYTAEYQARKPHWIAGTPTQGDLRGIRQIIAYRMAIPVAAVAEALRDQQEASHD